MKLETETTLNDLAPGERAAVVGYAPGSGAYRARLLSMGLTTGAELQMEKVAPLGDPVEITVRGFKLSIRKHEATVLKLRRLP